MQSLAAFLSRNKILILAFIFFFLFSVFVKVFADAPVGGYDSGATLDPNCEPGEIAPQPCIVKTVGGSDTSVQYNDNGVLTGDSNFTWDYANSRLGVGIATPSSLLHLVTESVTTGPNHTGINLDVYGNTAANFIGKRANGTIASPTVVLSGNNLASFGTYGYGTSGFQTEVNGLVRFQAAEDFTDSAKGTNLIFSLASVGSNSISEKMRLTSEGYLLLGTSSAYTTLPLQVASSGDATISSKSTANGTQSYGGINVFDYTGSLAASFQFGNSGATTFPNQVVIASRQSTIPVNFYQGGSASTNQRLVLGTDATIQLLNSRVGVNTTSPTTNFQVAQSTTGPGTISNSAGGTTVTGSSTQFLNTFRVGDTITANGETHTISAISSNTSMTTDAWTGANSGVTYTLTGGTRFSVLGNGRVGIGTTTPSKALEIVNSGIKISGGSGYETSEGDNAWRFIVDSGNSYAHSLMNLRNSTGDIFSVLGHNVGVGTDSPSTRFQVAQNTTGYGTVTTNGTTTLTGTLTQFLNTFKVGDTITVSGETRTIADIASNTSLTTTVAFTTSSSDLPYTLTGGTRFSVLGNGNVGIGTDTPEFNLHVFGTTDPVTAFIDSVGNSVASSIHGRRARGTVGALSAVQTNDNLMIFGGLGYGTTEYSEFPRANMKVQAAENWTDIAQGANLTFGTTANGTATLPLERMRIADDGGIFMYNLASGTGGASYDAICIDAVTEEITINTGGDDCVVSSARFKENITDLDLGLSFINTLTPRTFNYTGDNASRIGFIAEEIEQIDSRLVFYEDDNTTVRGVRYQDMSAALALAIQELDLKIEAIRDFEDESFVGKIKDWLASVENGIEEIFSKKITTEEFCIKDANGTSCWTREQLIEKLGDPSASEDDNNEEENENNGGNEEENNNEEENPPISLDDIMPEMTLNGDDTINLFVGDSYEELGATAFDNVDGDLTGDIMIIDSVNTGLAGEYTVTYSVSDGAGNQAQIERNVIVSEVEEEEVPEEIIEEIPEENEG